MSRLRRNHQRGKLTASIAAGDTSISSAGFASLPVIASPDYMMITLDPDGNPEIVKVTTHTSSATSVTVTRAQEGTSAQSHNSSTTWRHVSTVVDSAPFKSVVTPEEFGAVGDNTTNDTTAMNAALVAAAALGATLKLNNSYLCGALTWSNAVNCRVEGPGKITWTGTGSSPSGYIGLKLSGTCTNVEINGVRFVGDGDVANAHAGVWTDSGATLTNVRVVGCHVSSTVVGVQIGSSISSTDVGCLVQGCYIDSIVGTTSGNGYGIAKSGGSTSTHLRIIGNHIYGCQRHAIYFSVGSKGVIANNIIKDHRAVGGVTSNAGRIDAIVVARSQSVQVTGNLIYNAQDGGIDVEPDTLAGQNILGVNVTANILVDCLPYGIWVGSGNPSAAGMQACQAVNVVANEITANGVGSVIGIRVASGTRVRVGSNQIWFIGVTGVCDGIYIDATSETAGTANYTDHLLVDNNHIEGTASGGSFYGIGLASAFCTSSITAWFVLNTIVAATASWSSGASITNTNLTFVGGINDGFTMSGSTKLVRGSPQVLTGSKSWDPPNMADGTITSTTVTVTGAAVGDVAWAGFPLGGNDVLISAHVSATDTVYVTLLNKAGIARDFSTGTLTAWVVKA